MTLELIVKETEPRLQRHSALEHGELVVYSESATRGRTSEDGAMLCACAHGLLFAVADGVGGLPRGADAARAALETLGMRFGDGMQVELAYEEANAAVRELGGAACTIVSALLRDGELSTHHVGDAQAAIVGGRGKLKAITMPHNVVGHATAAGLLEEADATEHPERHIVTNTLGESVLRVERTSWGRLAQRDTVLLGSDGLFDTVPTDVIAALACRGKLAPMVEGLARRAREGRDESERDDLTIVAWRRSR